MKIVLTGMSGFVGQNLSKYLETKNYYVESLSLRNDWKLDKNADALIHLAGKAHDTANSSVAEKYFEINTDLTKKIFDEFLNSQINDFFYFSSVKAAADAVDGILEENHKSNPQTPYGKSKLMAEDYILSKELAEGKRVFILRPCMIHGPGNKGNLNLLFQMVKKGLPWPLGAFENRRSFLSIENLCFVIQELLENESIPSGVYQVADDEPLSTNELIQILGVSLNKKSSIWNIPISWINGISRLGDVLQLPLNTERLKKLTENYVVSNTKIISAIGKSLPVSSKEGLLKTFKSFKD